MTASSSFTVPSLAVLGLDPGIFKRAIDVSVLAPVDTMLFMLAGFSPLDRSDRCIGLAIIFRALLGCPRFAICSVGGLGISRTEQKGIRQELMRRGATLGMGYGQRLFQLGDTPMELGIGCQNQSF